MTPQRWLGVVLVVVGGVVALAFRDLEFLWFRGGPLGIVLVVIGVLDLAGSVRRRPGQDRRATGSRPTDGGQPPS